MINGNLDDKKINLFCKRSIIINKNTLNRSFPRVSKMAHSKWYGICSSNNAEIIKILIAIESLTTQNLHSNIKAKALRMKIISTTIT